MNSIHSHDNPTMNVVTMRELIRDKWWIISWLLTLSRIPLLVLCLTQIKISPLYSALLILAIMIADIFDGVLFKFSNANSVKKLRENRHIFDAIGDRLSINLTISFLYAFLGLPISILSLIVIREISISLIVFNTCYSNNIVIKANNYSKIASVLIGLIAINCILGMSMYWPLIVPFIIFSIIGAYKYCISREEC